MFLWKNGESEKKSEAISTVPPPPPPPPPKEFRHCSSLHPLILDFQTPLPNLKGEGEGG